MAALDYQAPDRGTGAGCGSLLLQTIAGFGLCVVCLVAARPLLSILPANTPFIVAFCCTAAAGLALTNYLAMTRHPGALIGFLIGYSFCGMFASICGGLFGW